MSWERGEYRPKQKRADEKKAPPPMHRSTLFNPRPYRIRLHTC